MKRKGFTLIELLAVIMVLAIMALISTPIILKVIEKAEKGSFEDSAYGVVDAARLYYANMNLDEKGKEETFTFPEDNKLKLSGKKPAAGKVVLEEDGKVGLAISNGKWCAIKNQSEEKISITDYSIGDCKIEGKETDDSCFIINDYNTITGYTCTDTDVIIPSEISGKTITEIGWYAFREKQLTSVKIPEGVTTIAYGAFYGNQLTSIEIPSSVINIDENAFYLNQLESLVIPDSVITIGRFAFQDNQLESVKISNNIKDLSEGVFISNHLIDVVIPDSVTSIGRNAFSSNQLTNVIIGDNVVNIGMDAFRNNQLTTLKVPSSVTTIEEEAFMLNQLATVTLQNGVENIKQQAFSNNQLASIEIPESVISIGYGAFYGNQAGMKVIVHKPQNSITGSPWSASSVEWIG